MSITALGPKAVTDVLHGTTVVDPYRWLEDRASSHTNEWLLDQSNRVDVYFSQASGVDSIRALVMTELNVQTVDQPSQSGARLFFRRREKDQQQGCIWVKDVLSQEERLLIDPSIEGPFISVGIHDISSSGVLLAYELRRGGEDAVAVGVVDVVSGIVLSNALGPGYSRGFTFATELSGFYYCHELRGEIGDHTIRFHRFSDVSSDEDRVVFRAPRSDTTRLVLIADPIHLGAAFIYGDGSEDKISFHLARRCRDFDWHPVFQSENLPFVPILKHGRIFVITNRDTEHKRLIETAEDGSFVREIVPASINELQQLSIVGNYAYARYVVEGRPVIQCHSLDGRYAADLPLPLEGSVYLIRSCASDTNTLFYTYESFTTPRSILQYPATTSEAPYWQTPSVRRQVPRCTAQVHKMRYPSPDGSSIPIYVVARDPFTFDSPRPVVMTSYGGFGTCVTPQFSVFVSILVELGAVFALPIIRGGSEFGRRWREAARGRHRQVAFDDFVAAALWLCQERITTPAHLAIFGGSNSGLLVGAAITQRPDLFRAAICIAPLLDMVRYEQFDRATKWRKEYGTVQDVSDFAAMYRYSPYHRVDSHTNYPATLFVSGDKDDRCNPSHARKMVARLQDRTCQTNPILLDYSQERGHSPSLPLAIRVAMVTRQAAFLCNELGIQVEL
jgi:prolyl oligopeptidase